MEPRGSTGCNHRQNAQARKSQKQVKTVATGRHPLPEKFHGKQGVCRGLPRVAGGPLPEKEGVDAYAGSSLRAYFFVQSGHGHGSQPQPVHALRIMAR